MLLPQFFILKQYTNGRRENKMLIIQKIDMIQGLIHGLKEQIYRMDSKTDSPEVEQTIIKEYLKAIKNIVNEEDDKKDPGIGQVNLKGK
jgi:hypothetical protein